MRSFTITHSRNGQRRKTVLRHKTDSHVIEKKCTMNYCQNDLANHANFHTFYVKRRHTSAAPNCDNSLPMPKTQSF